MARTHQNTVARCSLANAPPAPVVAVPEPAVVLFSLRASPRAERRKALRHSVCVPYDRHARLPALHLWRLVSYLGTVLPGPDRGAVPRPDPGSACAALHPDRVQPLKAAPHLVRWGRTVDRDDPGLCLRQCREPGATSCPADMTPHESALGRTERPRNNFPERKVKPGPLVCKPDSHSPTRNYCALRRCGSAPRRPDVSVTAVTGLQSTKP